MFIIILYHAGQLYVIIFKSDNESLTVSTFIVEHARELFIFVLNINIMWRGCMYMCLVCTYINIYRIIMHHKGKRLASLFTLSPFDVVAVCAV